MLEICFSASQNNYSTKTTLNRGDRVNAGEGLQTYYKSTCFGWCPKVSWPARIVSVSYVKHASVGTYILIFIKPRQITANSRLWFNLSA